MTPIEQIEHEARERHLAVMRAFSGVHLPAALREELYAAADRTLSIFQDDIYYEGAPTEGPEAWVRGEIILLLDRAYQAGRADERTSN